MNHPLVSVVITTKNEEKNISNCLKSIFEQTYLSCHCEDPEHVEGDVAISKPLIEIIVVDNNSTDKTKQIVSSFGHSREGRVHPEPVHREGNPVYNHISLYNHGPERSAQRNFGVKKTKGEYILYLDADMILSKDVIKNCVSKFENCKLKIGNSPLVALYISEIVMGDSFWCKVRRFERSFYDGTVIDCVRFISKKAFDAVKGFDENMSGPEDWDFDKKIRLIGKIALVKTPIYHNEQNFNLEQYLNKKNYYIKSFDLYVKKWGKDDADIKKQLGIFYRYFQIFTENGKWKKILTHPVLAFGMYTLKFFIGLKFITRNRISS